MKYFIPYLIGAIFAIIGCVLWTALILFIGFPLYFAWELKLPTEEEFWPWQPVHRKWSDNYSPMFYMMGSFGHYYFDTAEYKSFYHYMFNIQ